MSHHSIPPLIVASEIPLTLSHDIFYRAHQLLNSPPHVLIGKLRLSSIPLHSPTKATSTHSHTNTLVASEEGRREIYFHDFHSEIQGRSRSVGKKNIIGSNMHLELP